MKIILRMPNWIGDCVMATAVLPSIRKCYPQAHITALVAKPLKSLLQKNPHLDRIIGFCRKKRYFPEDGNGQPLIQQLRKEQYDLGILFTKTLSSAWIFYQARVKKRVGYGFWGQKFLLTKSFLLPKQLEKQHLVDTYQDLLSHIGIPKMESEPWLGFQKMEKPIGRIWIGINPGAAYGSAKCWLKERFHEVIYELLDWVPYVDIFVFGDAKTKPLVDDLTEEMPDNVKNLAGKTTLEELVNMVASLDVFLTNDSGPMHIAAACKTPLVALFGSTNPTKTGPYKWGHVIYQHLSCSPCYLRKCPIDFLCMRAIGVPEVVQAIKEALLQQKIKNKAIKPCFTKAKEPIAFIASKKHKVHKNVATIILAGGEGRRLGSDQPKGCLKVLEKPLFEHLLEKTNNPVAIMTSPATHTKTLVFAKQRGWASDVEFFQMPTLPRLSGRGDAPEGNGALFTALYASPLWQKWQNIDAFVVTPVDNPLANPSDEELLQNLQELSVRAVSVEHPDEKIGRLIDLDGRLYVSEYMECTEIQKKNWLMGYSGIFAGTKNFFTKAAKKELPWHRIDKLNSSHYEKFVFDAFSASCSYQVVLGSRKEMFLPIKEKSDIAALEKLCYTRGQTIG